MEHLLFSVIESRWFDTGNDTVKSFFESIASIYCNNPSSFFHHSFNEKNSLRKALEECCKDKQTEIIYLATHGNAKAIGPDDVCISRTGLRNMISKVNTKKTIKGIFLGTCETGNEYVARYLLEDKSTHLEWVAGYNSSIDWIDGTAMDMMFFSKLAEQYRQNKSRKKNKFSSRKMAHLAASELLKIVPGAFIEYGFNIYFHERNKLTSMFIDSIE
ncbi:hypothetical protein [Pasteurella multocida]|uniref:hypothetical protein n=1 Tax=Pasteurella multocida TaxID=747 RepID=UPI002D1F0424|nr:hypothetical protein [Pasteurella multocida]MEB4561016.1 hypothetical protein [Pasteurella multocida]